MTDPRARPWPLLIARVVLTVAVLAEAAAFAGDVAAGSASNASADGLAAVLTLVLALATHGAIRNIRARAGQAAAPPESLKTHAEETAEAVEALRQQKWDAIADRAYLAAGGQKPRIALKVDPVRWLASAADEFMRTGERPRGPVLPEGVTGVQADVLPGQRKRQREVRLTAWLENGDIIWEARQGNGAANGLPLGMAFTLPDRKPLPGPGGFVLPAGAVIVPCQTSMSDMALGFARLGAALGPCAHPDAEPVDLITGERVAWVCPDCPADLPAGWR